MGSLIGHIIPGTFTLIIGFWWTYNIFKRYFVSCVRPSNPAVNALSYPWRKKVPLDMYFIFFAGIAGVAADIVANFPELQMQNIHHISMYILFELTAIACILKGRKWSIPENLEYVLFALAFAVQGMLFYFHTIGRSKLDVMLHLFLCYADAAIVACTLLEVAHPRSVLVAISKCFFIIVNGIWYFQVGAILYPPSGEEVDGDDQKTIMMVPVYFTWDIITTILVMTSLAVWQYRKVSGCGSVEKSYNLIPNGLDPEII